MATLEKIRSKAGLLVLVVGVALFAFIIGDFLNSGSTYFRQSQETVAEVDGEVIKIQEFQDRVDEMTEMYKMQTGSTSLPEEYQTQIRQSVFDGMVQDIVLNEATSELGMGVGPEELFDMVQGENISPMIQQMQMFVNPQTGAFDKTALLNFLKTIDDDNIANYPADQQAQLLQGRQFWMFWEKNIKRQRLEQKYTTLLSKAVSANKLDAKDAFDGSAVSSDIVYAMQSYASIPDSTIQVSKSDIEKLYNQRKELFKQKEGKVIKYIAVDIRPSKEDYDKASAEIESLKSELATSEKVADLFDGEKYRLQKFWKGKQDHHQKMTSLEKAIVEADEKVGLILMLQNGTLIRPLPEDGSVEPVSDTKIQAELLYNRIPFSKLLFMFNLTVGMLAFFRLLYRGLRRSSALSDSSGRIVALSFSSRLADTFFPFSLYAAFLFQLFGYGLRWYIGGRIPLGNGYETMQFMALCALFLACLFRRRFPFMVPFGFLLSGFALLVSYLGQMNPQITPLMPVLVSPWLSTHVSLIMMSYALFAFMMLNGILALCLRRSARMLMLLSRLLLYPAVFFLGAGIFLGAVWANASWGRYWAWDPKEVWALITFMVYGAAFHARSLRIFRSPLFFHIYMIVAFLTVLMTYFGVNYILGGMHSYANA